jgi:hypothetical protein
MANDEAWEALLLLASVPLRELGADLRPIDAGSGCLVEYRGRRLLLTVAHVTGNYGRWAIEVRPGPPGTIQLYQIGQLNYVAELVLEDLLNLDDDGIERRRVDLAYTEVPKDVRPLHLVFDGRTKIQEHEREVLVTDLSARPRSDGLYGFSGQADVDAVGNEVHSDVRLETHLRFTEQIGGEYIFELGHPNPGGRFYKGCSGAPVLSREGDLVGLLIGRTTDIPERLRVVSLADYRSAIDATLDEEAPSSESMG